MKVKNTIMTLGVLISTLTVQAQKRDFNFFVKAGLDISNVASQNQTLNMNERNAFRIGGGLDFYLNKNFGLETGLFLTSKGAKKNGETIDSKLSYNFRYAFKPMYIEMPVMALMRLDLTNKVNLIFNAGPYLAYGIGGKETYSEGVYYNKSENIFGGDNSMARIDAGLGFGASVEFMSFMFGVDSRFGLTPLEATSEIYEQKLNLKNRTISITLGYKF